MRGAVATVVFVACMASLAHADNKKLDQELLRGSVIYQRGGMLYRSTAKGGHETDLTPILGRGTVRVMRTDPKGQTLLVDVDGKWSWMPLDGAKKTLTPLACGAGPATLDLDGTCVLCRDPAAKGDRSVVIVLATGQQLRLPVSPDSARLVGHGAARRLVWSDAHGVWSAPPADLRKRKKVAPQPPIDWFSPSLDGTRAVGVYHDYEYTGRKRKKISVDGLMTFDLDGTGARRKAIRKGVPLDWSFDNEYVLVQEGTSACLMRANGGQYKCWKGFTAVSIAPDGSYALVLGHRDGGRLTNEPTSKLDDTPAPPPKKVPLSLFRAQLAGAFTIKPILVTKVVDGAAVWVPGT